MKPLRWIPGMYNIYLAVSQKNKATDNTCKIYYFIRIQFYWDSN